MDLQAKRPRSLSGSALRLWPLRHMGLDKSEMVVRPPRRKVG